MGPGIDPMAGAVGGLAGIAGLGGGIDPFAAVLPVLVTTFGGVAMVMAFGLFGMRRRDGGPTDSDDALAAAAATGIEAAASSSLVGIAVDAELAMPRWRRPSLLEARKADPLRSAAPADISLTFDRGLVAPVDGRERRRIRYRVVRLLDAPDELTASDVGVLDAGDEVQLLERSGVYWFVLCPDGQRGWVHKMVLGDVVEDPELPGPAARAIEPRQAGEAALTARLASGDPVVATGSADPGGYDPTMPSPAWATRVNAAADVGVDDDVLQAFLASRSRA